MTRLSKVLTIAGFSFAFSIEAALALDVSQPQEPPIREELDCIKAAAPVQYGGISFDKIEPETAIGFCEKALPLSSSAAIKAFYARALEKEGRTTRARLLTQQAAKENDPTALVAQAHYLSTDGSSDGTAKAIELLAAIMGQSNDWQARNLNANLHIQAFQAGNIDSATLLIALGQLKEAADEGSPYGLFLQGWLYENGVGYEKDLTESERFYREAVTKGEIAAQAFLGHQLEISGTAPEEAADLIWQAFKQKNDYAIDLLRNKGSERSPATVAFVKGQLKEAGLLKTISNPSFDKATKTALMKANGEVVPKAQAPYVPLKAKTKSSPTRTKTRAKKQTQSKKKKKNSREGR
ncbi:sel1 repeat family protein [Alphaproteobacteria bacterium]|nr:sel1 repeat family protein [Alphaproteobacteria bacterium]